MEATLPAEGRYPSLPPYRADPFFQKKVQRPPVFPSVDSLGSRPQPWPPTLMRPMALSYMWKELGFFLNNMNGRFRSCKTGNPLCLVLIGGRPTPLATETHAELHDLYFGGKGWPTLDELGHTGGSTHHYPVYKPLLNVSEFGMIIQEAVDTACFHHQWIPDIVQFELRFVWPSSEANWKQGYTIDEKNAPSSAGGCHSAGVRWLLGGWPPGDDTAVDFKSV